MVLEPQYPVLMPDGALCLLLSGLFRFEIFWAKEFFLEGLRTKRGQNFGLQNLLLCTHSHISPPITTTTAYSSNYVRKNLPN